LRNIRRAESLAIGDDGGPGLNKLKLSRSTQAAPWYDAQVLLDAITDYAIYQIDPDGYVCSWNASAQRLKGYRAKDIIGQHFSRFYTPEDVADGLPRRALWTAASEGKFEDEGWRVRADGSRMWAGVVINPILDENGSILGFVKITRDLSARHEVEQTLHEANQAIAKMQKMHALGRIAGGIAHDFNNMLTAILTSLDTMKRSADPATLDSSIAAIEVATDQAAQLTSQLLSFARNQTLAPVRVSVRKCLEDMLPVLRTTVRSTVSFHARLAPDDCPAHIDVPQFRAAIINLVSNANDATDDGGIIVIKLELVNALPKIRTHKPVRRKHIAISVTDNGSGIPPEIIDSVFEPFFTTKPVNHGTGLGLSQVYGFTKQSGGNVVITPGSDHGTTVTIYLPLAADAELREEAPQAGADIAELRKAFILLVEDNKIIGVSAARALTNLGYGVVWLHGAEAALDLLACHPHAFDVVISDVEMPGIGGLALAEKIAADFPHLPVILTSGTDQDIAGNHANRENFMRKPYTISDIVGVIDAVLREQPAASKGKGVIS